MLNVIAKAAQTVAVNQNVVFTNTRVKSRRCACTSGWLNHDDGSGLFEVTNRGKPSDNQELTKVEPNNNQTKTKPKPNQNQTITTPEPNVYVNVNDNVNANKKKDTSVSKEKASRFIPPTIEDIKAYCEEKGYKLDYDRFIDYYTSNGWMVGKNKMKDWRACVRNWARKDSSGCAEYPTKVSKFRNFQERSYDMDKLTRELLGG